MGIVEWTFLFIFGAVVPVGQFVHVFQTAALLLAIMACVVSQILVVCFLYLLAAREHTGSVPGVSRPHDLRECSEKLDKLHSNESAAGEPQRQGRKELPNFG